MTYIDCVLGCGGGMEVPLPKTEIKDFQENRTNRRLIQDEFPDLSVDEREAILTGICALCWERMHKENVREVS